MSKKDVVMSLLVLVLMIVLIFFGYKDYQRQKALVQPGEPQSAPTAVAQPSNSR